MLCSLQDVKAYLPHCAHMLSCNVLWRNEFIHTRSGFRHCENRVYTLLPVRQRALVKPLLNKISQESCKLLAVERTRKRARSLRNSSDILHPFKVTGSYFICIDWQSELTKLYQYLLILTYCYSVQFVNIYGDIEVTYLCKVQWFSEKCQTALSHREATRKSFRSLCFSFLRVIYSSINKCFITIMHYWAGQESKHEVLITRKCPHRIHVNLAKFATWRFIDWQQIH